MRWKFLILGLLLSWSSFAEDQPRQRQEEETTPWKWKPSGQYFRLTGSYTFYAMNYASDASAEFQEIALGHKDRYEFRFNFGFLNKFGDQAVFFGVGGDYSPWKRLKLSLDTRFAPSQTVPPRQDYAAGLFYQVIQKWAELGARYRWRDYRQANLQEAGPVVHVGWLEHLWLTGSYLFNRTNQHGGGDFSNQAFETRLDVKISSVGLNGFYGRSGHDFEAGAPDNPFKSFGSHDFGGGIKISFMMGSGLFFEFRGEDRDNGQNQQVYTVGTFFEM